MSKGVNWNKHYRGAIRGHRPGGTWKEKMAKAHQREESAEQAKAHFQTIEPALRKSLLDHMVNHKPITVLAPIKNVGDVLTKSHGYQTGVQEIPVGTVLTFDVTDKTMGQWIFKSVDAKGNEDEVAIYNSPVVLVPGPQGTQQQVPNGGFWGLLTSTSIYKTVVDALNAEGE